MKQLQGFTLVELMVTIVIAGILITVGVPSLISMYEGFRGNSNIDKINNILKFARNQAMSYGTTVNVCPYASPTSCSTTTDWSNGIRVFVTSNGADVELRSIDSFGTNDKAKGPSGIISFNSEGLSSNAIVIYCPSNKTQNSKSVNITSSGLISYGAEGLSC